MTRLPYVPPSSEIDPPPAVLVMLFLQAVARVTDAFKELREEILPLCGERTLPLAKISDWLERWHLNDFPNYELNEKIDSWIHVVLYQWRHDPDGARTLRIEPVRRQWPPAKKVQFEFYEYDLYRESFEDWGRALREKCEGVIAAERAKWEIDQDRFGMKPYLKRDRGRPHEWEFEWLAYSRCNLRSDQWIANRPKYKAKQIKRSTVNKARIALLEALKAGK